MRIDYRSSLAGALARRSLLAYLMLTVAGAAALAQQGAPEAGKQTAPLPETIHLALRGKPGDTYTYSSHRTMSGNMHITVAERDLPMDITTDKTYSYIWRGAGPDGTVKLEVRSSGGKRRETREGGSVRQETLPAIDALFTLKPTRERVKVVPLSLAPGAPSAGKKKPGSARQRKPGPPKALSPDKVNEILKEAVSIFNPSPFPAQALRVGDTWSGVTPHNPYDEAEQGAPLTKYTSKLVAIEMHRGVLCARVETVLTFEGDVPALKAGFLKTAPPGAKMTGTASSTGHAISFYGLDRGRLLDEDMTTQFGFKYTISFRDQSTGTPITMEMEAKGTEEQHQTATRFPPYDPSLLPAPMPNP